MKLTYAVREDHQNFLKIGCSWNVPREVQLLQQALPDIRLVAVTNALESAALRTQFARLHVGDGWFRPARDLLTRVEAIGVSQELLDDQAKNPTQFGAWLEEHGVTAADAARELGVTRAHAHVLARGKGKPSTRLAAAIEAWTRELDPDWPIRLGSWE